MSSIATHLFLHSLVNVSKYNDLNFLEQTSLVGLFEQIEIDQRFFALNHKQASLKAKHLFLFFVYARSLLYSILILLNYVYDFADKEEDTFLYSKINFFEFTNFSLNEDFPEGIQEFALDSKNRHFTFTLFNRCWNFALGSPDFHFLLTLLWTAHFKKTEPLHVFWKTFFNHTLYALDKFVSEKSNPIFDEVSQICKKIAGDLDKNLPLILNMLFLNFSLNFSIFSYICHYNFTTVMMAKNFLLQTHQIGYFAEQLSKKPRSEFPDFHFFCFFDQQEKDFIENSQELPSVWSQRFSLFSKERFFEFYRGLVIRDWLENPKHPPIYSFLGPELSFKPFVSFFYGGSFEMEEINLFSLFFMFDNFAEIWLELSDY